MQRWTALLNGGCRVSDIRVGVHPTLLTKIDHVLAAIAALGFPMRICQGVRTVDQQQALYAQGRTTPGPIVTKADGIHTLSNHQAKADGFGHAVDCCFMTDPFGEHQPWNAYGAMVEAMGLTWGGGADFLKSGINDRPHAELRP